MSLSSTPQKSMGRTRDNGLLKPPSTGIYSPSHSKAPSSHEINATRLLSKTSPVKIDHGPHTQHIRAMDYRTPSSKRPSTSTHKPRFTTFSGTPDTNLFSALDRRKLYASSISVLKHKPKQTPQPQPQSPRRPISSTSSISIVSDGDSRSNYSEKENGTPEVSFTRIVRPGSPVSRTANSKTRPQHINARHDANTTRTTILTNSSQSTSAYYEPSSAHESHTTSESNLTSTSDSGSSALSPVKAWDIRQDLDLEAWRLGRKTVTSFERQESEGMSMRDLESRARRVLEKWYAFNYHDGAIKLYSSRLCISKSISLRTKHLHEVLATTAPHVPTRTSTAAFRTPSTSVQAEIFRQDPAEVLKQIRRRFGLDVLDRRIEAAKWDVSPEDLVEVRDTVYGESKAGYEVCETIARPQAIGESESEILRRGIVASQAEEKAPESQYWAKMAYHPNRPKVRQSILDESSKSHMDSSAVAKSTHRNKSIQDSVLSIDRTPELDDLDISDIFPVEFLSKINLSTDSSSNFSRSGSPSRSRRIQHPSSSVDEPDYSNAMSPREENFEVEEIIKKEVNKMLGMGIDSKSDSESDFEFYAGPEHESSQLPLLRELHLHSQESFITRKPSADDLSAFEVDPPMTPCETGDPILGAMLRRLDACKRAWISVDSSVK